MLIKYTFMVKRPPEEVFDYFANIENVPEWADNIKSEQFTTNDGPHLGARFREDGRRNPGTLALWQRFSPHFQSCHTSNARSSASAAPTAVPGGEGNPRKIGQKTNNRRKI